MDNNNTPLYSLVTGASKGLGKAYAFELAAMGRNVILVSLPEEGLEEVASALKKKGVDAVFYETDLTEKKNILELADRVNQNFQVDLLINNAGIGGFSPFLDADIHFLDQMIQLNVKATSLITHTLLPNLLRQKRAYVLNVASLAALTPMAYKMVYPATKAFIHSFTRGLQHEYANTNIFFSVVNPGPMHTNGVVGQHIKDQGFWSQILELKPEKVASVSLKKLFKGEKVIKLDWAHMMSLMLLKLPTGMKMSILERATKKSHSS